MKAFHDQDTVALITWWPLIAIANYSTNHHVLSTEQVDNMLLPQVFLIGTHNINEINIFSAIGPYLGGPSINYQTHLMLSDKLASLIILDSF